MSTDSLSLVHPEHLAWTREGTRGARHRTTSLCRSGACTDAQTQMVSQTKEGEEEAQGNDVHVTLLVLLQSAGIVRAVEQARVRSARRAPRASRVRQTQSGEQPHPSQRKQPQSHAEAGLCSSPQRGPAAAGVWSHGRRGVAEGAALLHYAAVHVRHG